jgi:hypothetical protein
MFKRPAIRPREAEKPLRRNEICRNEFLQSIIRPKPVQFYKHPKVPIYQQENYIKLLNKNRRELGLEEVVPDLPPEPIREVKVVKAEPYIDALDKIHMTTQVLKNGKIKVKLNTSMMDLNEKYYSKNKVPPSKTLLKVYKSLGFSGEFIDKLDKRLSKRPAIIKVIEDKIDKVFNKPTAPKPKKKKEPEPVDIDDEDVEEDVEEDDDPGEDGEMDVDVEPEDDEEQGAGEEEFFIDDD